VERARKFPAKLGKRLRISFLSKRRQLGQQGFAVISAVMVASLGPGPRINHENLVEASKTLLSIISPSAIIMNSIVQLATRSARLNGASALQKANPVSRRAFTNGKTASRPLQKHS
jgi:hypothetical protein